jgi:radical SAM superfamily enzyme YgiQ (UPF0313 family)
MVWNSLPSFVTGEIGFLPPIGLLSLAAYIQKHTPHEVEVLDTPVLNMDYSQIEDYITRSRPHVVGINCYTWTLMDALLTARLVKKVGKDIPVVFGGYHTFLYPKETIRFPEIDYLIIGAGEKPFTALLQCIDDPVAASKIPGVVSKCSENIDPIQERQICTNMDDLPFPARELTPIDKYYLVTTKRPPATVMVTSFGCPYNCLFCLSGKVKKMIFQTPKRTVDEIEHCVSLGINEFFFFDESFTYDRDRVIKICEEILRRHLDISWDARTRINLVDPELLKIMRKAGCERIQYGVEAGTQEIVNILRKGIKIEQVKEVFTYTKRAGITTYADFMIGSPTETKGQILQTIDFARKLDADYAQFGVTTPWPFTDLYTLAFEKGLFKEDHWKRFAENPYPNFSPPVWEENLSKDELLALCELAYKRFYIRPKIILNQLLHIRSFRVFLKKCKAAFSMFMGE